MLEYIDSNLPLDQSGSCAGFILWTPVDVPKPFSMTLGRFYLRARGLAAKIGKEREGKVSSATRPLRAAKANSSLRLDNWYREANTEVWIDFFCIIACWNCRISVSSLEIWTDRLTQGRMKFPDRALRYLQEPVSEFW